MEVAPGNPAPPDNADSDQQGTAPRLRRSCPWTRHAAAATTAVNRQPAPPPPAGQRERATARTASCQRRDHRHDDRAVSAVRVPRPRSRVEHRVRRIGRGLADRCTRLGGRQRGGEPARSTVAISSCAVIVSGVRDGRPSRWRHREAHPGPLLQLLDLRTRSPAIHCHSARAADAVPRPSHCTSARFRCLPVTHHCRVVTAAVGHHSWIESLRMPRLVNHSPARPARHHDEGPASRGPGTVLDPGRSREPWHGWARRPGQAEDGRRRAYPRLRRAAGACFVRSWALGRMPATASGWVEPVRGPPLRRPTCALADVPAGGR